MTPKEQAAMQQALGALEQLGYGMCYAAIDLREALAEQAEQEPAGLKECRHCGFLCAPNSNESKRWYPLEQPISQEPKSDCPCCGAKSSVLSMAFCRECRSEFWPPQPVRTKDLTDEELNAMWYGNTKDGWLGLFRAVIAADRELNK